MSVLESPSTLEIIQPDIFPGFDVFQEEGGALSLQKGWRSYHLLAAHDGPPYCEDAEPYFFDAFEAESLNPISGVKVCVYLRDSNSLMVEKVEFDADVIQKNDGSHPVAMITSPESLRGFIVSPPVVEGRAWTLVRAFSPRNFFRNSLMFSHYDQMADFYRRFVNESFLKLPSTYLRDHFNLVDIESLPNGATLFSHEIGAFDHADFKFMSLPEGVDECVISSYPVRRSGPRGKRQLRHRMAVFCYSDCDWSDFSEEAQPKPVNRKPGKFRELVWGNIVDGEGHYFFESDVPLDKSRIDFSQGIRFAWINSIAHYQAGFQELLIELGLVAPTDHPPREDS